MDDSLAPAPGRVQRHAELLAVLPERVELSPRQWIGYRALLGRDVVVHRRDGEIGTADPAPCKAQAFERLRGRHLVDQVQDDVEQRVHVGRLDDDVPGPDALEQRSRCHRVFLADGL
jgi:hypothetical protein